MTIKSSGPISIGDINSELGLSRTTPKNLGNSAVRSLLERTSGAVPLSSAYGKRNGPPLYNFIPALIAGGGVGYIEDGWAGATGQGVMSQTPVYYNANARIVCISSSIAEREGWNLFSITTNIDVGSTLYFTLNGTRYGIPKMDTLPEGVIYFADRDPVLYPGAGYTISFG